MPLALFDLDNTLLADDSDYLWGEFLATVGVVDGEEYRQANDRFYADYRAGQLDIYAFLRFSLKPLADHPLPQLLTWREQFMAEVIRPKMLPKAFELIEQHRQRGDTLMVITATNRFVTEPIVQAYGIEELIATEPEFRDGRYSGEVAGTPAFQHGKVVRLEQWLAEKQLTLEGSHFYSDSHNDLPLLERVSQPVVVDGDLKLRQIATERGWRQISLRA